MDEKLNFTSHISKSWSFIETAKFDTMQSKTDNLQIIHPASPNILPSCIA